MLACRAHLPSSRAAKAATHTYGSHPARSRSMQRLPLVTAGASRSGQTAVAESLHLLRFPADAQEEDISQMVDGIWSLQYLAAGPICGSAGKLLHFRHHSSSSSSGGSVAGTAGASTAQPFTHAVLFRYANDANLERFEQQPRVQLMLGGTGAPEGTGIATINFRGSVPSELEAIFRRGGEWVEGAELALALAQQGVSSEEEAAEFLSLTQQLALSSAFAAVQCSYGGCLSVQHSAGSGESGGSGSNSTDASSSSGQQLPPPDMMLLARFQDAQQLAQFLECPPVAALLEGDDRLPLRALWSAVLEVTPSDSSSSRGLVGGGVM